MARSLAAIEQEIRELEPSAQEDLLRILVEELDGPPDFNVEAAWLEEALRRSAEIDSGAVQCVLGDEVFRKADSRLKK